MRQFLGFFQDFTNLCQCGTWPSDDTSEDELKNAFLTARHVEKCLDRLQKNNLLDNFLTVVNDNDDKSIFIKNCFSDPTKYILKKILHAKVKVSQIDIGFKIFLDLYSEQKLEDCLTELMVEAASKETLVRNLNEIPKDKIVVLKCKLFLSELECCENAKETILDMLKNTDKDTVELLTISLLNKDAKYLSTVAVINEAFVCTMTSKSHINQSFWKYLLNMDENILIEMCLEHTNVFHLVSKAFIDCGKLLRENMSLEFFYINLMYAELVFAVQMICKNPALKEEFFVILNESTSDRDFWEAMLL